MSNDLTLVQVNHIFSDIGGKICDAFEMAGDCQIVKDRINRFRVLADILLECCDAFLLQAIMFGFEVPIGFGVSGQEILDFVEVIGTRRVGQVFEGQRRFPLAARLPDRHRTEAEAIRSAFTLGCISSDLQAIGL